MKEIFVYHGGTDRIENPICKFGRANLDFGQGFYVTDLLEQALTWGKNDRVIDTINLYISGLMDMNTALGELSKHQPNNQICIINQEIINQYLIFDGTEQ